MCSKLPQSLQSPYLLLRYFVMSGINWLDFPYFYWATNQNILPLYLCWCNILTCLPTLTPYTHHKSTNITWHVLRLCLFPLCCQISGGAARGKWPGLITIIFSQGVFCHTRSCGKNLRVGPKGWHYFLSTPATQPADRLYFFSNCFVGTQIFTPTQIQLNPTLTQPHPTQTQTST